MASEEIKKPLDEAAVKQITEIVRNILLSTHPDDVESSVRRSYHASAPRRPSSFSSDALYTAPKSTSVLSPEWYKDLRPVLIRSPFESPRRVHMPDFFRIRDALHNSIHACDAVTPNSRSEADLLYQIQAFVHENLNRQLSVMDEFCTMDVPKVIVDVIEENWRHLYGVSEMIQARYDVLCGKRSNDEEQTRLLDLCTRPPVGSGSFARTINHNLRKMWIKDGLDFVDTNVRRETSESDFSQDSDNDSHTRGRERLEMTRRSVVPGAVTKDKFGLATTWDRVAHSDTKASGGKTNTEEGSFVYLMRNHDLIKEHVMYSPWYCYGGFRWRLLVYPQTNRHFDDLMNVYLICGGPEEKDENEEVRPDRNTNSIKKDNNPDWFCGAEFSLRLLHPSSKIAKEVLKRDIGEMNNHEDLHGSNQTAGSINNTSPDLVEEFYHVFRHSSNDWGGGIAPFSMLQPGKYADRDMNIVFFVTIRVQPQSL